VGLMQGAGFCTLEIAEASGANMRLAAARACIARVTSSANGRSVTAPLLLCTKGEKEG